MSDVRVQSSVVSICCVCVLEQDALPALLQSTHMNEYHRGVPTRGVFVQGYELSEENCIYMR